MIASLVLASPTGGESHKHIPHALLPLLKYGHGVPLMAGVAMVVLLICFAFFKLTQIRPRYRM
jgi:hypothetical protein